MTPSDYDKVAQRVKALGDVRLLRDEEGYCTMVTLDDESVGIYQQDLSPRFRTLGLFEDWLNYVEEIFRG
jgi:hypothetical protein